MKKNVQILLGEKALLDLVNLSLKDHFTFNKGSGPIILDLDNFQKIDQAISTKDIFLISNLPDEENIKLIKKHHLKHVFGQNSSVLDTELKSTLIKYFKEKFWGLQSYLNSEAQFKEFSLSESNNSTELIKEELLHFDFKDYFSSPVEYIEVIANELVTNSLYKGLNKKRQAHGEESVDRYSPVTLGLDEKVKVEIGMDDHYVGLAVLDSFGELNFDTLITFLTRGFEEKTVMEKKDGAGIGLYLTFMMCNQFIVNFSKGKKTEIICIIDKNKRHKNYKERITSFHFIEEDSE